MMKYPYINTSLLCFVLFQSCHYTTDEGKEKNIPPVFIRTDDPALRHSGGMWCLGHTPFSGWMYSLYDTGDTASIGTFFNGREHGTARTWYPNRQLKEIRHWINGRKTGEHKGWWEGGRLRFVYQFSNDVY